MKIIETNIDDMNPEVLGSVMERLLSMGAKDVWAESIHMKKNRQGTLLKVIADDQDTEKLSMFIMQHTTTFGVRVYPVERMILERKMEHVDTEFGRVSVKLGFMEGLLIKASPEYEDMKRCAASVGLSVLLVEEAARAAIWEKYREELQKGNMGMF